MFRFSNMLHNISGVLCRQNSDSIKECTLETQRCINDKIAVCSYIMYCWIHNDYIIIDADCV